MRHLCLWLSSIHYSLLLGSLETLLPVLSFSITNIWGMHLKSPHFRKINIVETQQMSTSQIWQSQTYLRLFLVSTSFTPSMSSSENSWDLTFTWPPDHHLTFTWPQHNQKYYATAISSPDHFLNQSAFRKLDINQSQVLKFNQASLSATM